MMVGSFISEATHIQKNSLLTSEVWYSSDEWYSALYPISGCRIILLQSGFNVSIYYKVSLGMISDLELFSCLEFEYHSVWNWDDCVAVSVS